MSRKDRFEPPDDERFTDLTGRKEDANCTVRPTLCELLPARLVQILWHDLLKVRHDRKTWPRVIVPSSKNAKQDKEKQYQEIKNRTQLRDIFCRKGQHDRLEDLVKVIEDLGYSPQVLLSRKAASQSYRLLVDTIGELGPQPELGAKHSSRQHAIDACSAFARVLGPDCWTAYFRNRRLNRANFLGEWGLKFPEAMCGFAWKNDLPTRILFNDLPDDIRKKLNLLNDGPVQLYPPSVLTELLKDGGQMTGTFRRREQMDENRAIGIRLLWANSTLVLFLGWRVAGATNDGDPQDPKQKRNATDFWNEVVELEKLDVEPGRILNSLTLATRYLNVWLAAGCSCLAEEEFDRVDELALARSSRPDYAVMIQRVAAAAKVKDKERRADELRIALSVAIPNAHHYHVHWLEKKRGRPPVLRLRNAKLIKSDDGYVEDCDDGPDPPGSKSGERTYALRIEAEDPHDQQLIARRSVCVQSLLWRVGLLIDHSTCKEFWTKRRLSREEFPNQVGELAVPILDEKGEACGVISVESHQSLAFDDLRRVEMISHLYRKLQRVFADEKREEGVVGLPGLDDARPIDSFQHIGLPHKLWTPS